MICNKCGTPNPDGAISCARCGAPLAAVQPPVQGGYPAPNFGQQPQPQFQQPQQMYGQPVYPGPAAAQQPRAGMKPATKAAIISSVIWACIAGFLVVLFLVILPKNGGSSAGSSGGFGKSALAHKWIEEGYSNSAMDLKNNTITIEGTTISIKSWELNGNKLHYELEYQGETQSTDVFCALSGDGKTLLVYTSSGSLSNDLYKYSPTGILTMAD